MKNYFSGTDNYEDIKNSDVIIITAGVPFNIPGTTNILRVAPVNESLIHAGEIE